jgi:hypothetical protein
MNKKIITIFSGIAVFALAMIFAFGIPSESAQAYDSPYKMGHVPPPELILEFIAGDRVSSLEEARQLVGYDVKEPTYLPNGYTIQGISVEKNNEWVTMIASKYQVTNETTDHEFFWQQQGILIFIEPANPNNDPQTYKEDFLETYSKNGGREYPLNDKTVLVHEIREVRDIENNLVHTPAELIMFEDKLEKKMRGFVSAEELLKIAETL